MYKDNMVKDSRLYIALINYDDSCKTSANPLPSKQFQSDTNRLNLLDLLEKQGLYIVPKEFLIELRTSLNDLAQGGTNNNYEFALKEIEKINKLIL
jgi:hypothetical protein